MRCEACDGEGKPGMYCNGSADPDDSEASRQRPMIWAVWRDAGGNLGVAAYPDVQLARYASKALDRVVLDVCATNDEAQTKRQALAERFAITEAANDAMDRIAKYTGRMLMNEAGE